MDLSVIIVNWNAGGFAIQAIDSLAATAGPSDYEVVVVDNASTDASRALLARSLPRTRVIFNPINTGFAAASNLGAAETSGDVLLFLNPDTRVLEGAVQRMLAALASSPDVGAVGPRLLNGDGTLQTSCVLAFPTIANQLLDAEWLRRCVPRYACRGTAPLLRTHPARLLVDVDAVSGASLMVRREVFDLVSGFSQDYFLYSEDVDLCYRIRQAAFRVCHIPSASIVHHGGRSSAQQQHHAYAAVLQRESTYRLLRKVRGSRYATRYRYALRMAAIVRITVLAVVWLLPRFRESTAASLHKWHRILRWTFKLETWAERLAPLSANGLRP